MAVPLLLALLSSCSESRPPRDEAPTPVGTTAPRHDAAAAVARADDAVGTEVSLRVLGMT